MSPCTRCGVDCSGTCERWHPLQLAEGTQPGTSKLVGPMSEPNPFGCIEPHGRKDRFGYVHQGSGLAHVIAWEQANGPVPADLELDHLCRNTSCSRICHLEPITREENELRKSWKYRARRTSCPQGHLLATNRIVTRNGGIVCRTCNREDQR